MCNNAKGKKTISKKQLKDYSPSEIREVNNFLYYLYANHKGWFNASLNTLASGKKLFAWNNKVLLSSVEWECIKYVYEIEQGYVSSVTNTTVSPSYLESARKYIYVSENWKKIDWWEGCYEYKYILPESPEYSCFPSAIEKPEPDCFTSYSYSSSPVLDLQLFAKPRSIVKDRKCYVLNYLRGLVQIGDCVFEVHTGKWWIATMKDCNRSNCYPIAGGKKDWQTAKKALYAYWEKI